ncbi:MAG TPA: acyltransferase [Pirellulales bacterium]|nr:acyltransferase [Pirellulales bacterium]
MLITKSPSENRRGLPHFALPAEQHVPVPLPANGFRRDSKPSSKDRLHYLDGLRGVASVAVVLWHNFLAFFPGAVMPDVPMRSSVLEKHLYRSPFSIFFAGDFAVYVFFMMSGFVISLKFFQGADSELLQKGFLRRYVRLMPAAFVTVIAAYLILSLGLMYNNQAGDIANSWWLKLNWKDVSIHFKNALSMGLYGLWFNGIPASAHFNSNLGTLAIELIGSWIIFAAILIMMKLNLSFRQRLIFHAGLIALAFVLDRDDPHYLVFFIGMAAADIYANGDQFYDRLTRFRYLVLLLGVWMGGMNIGNISHTIYRPLAGVCKICDLHPLTYPWAIGSVFLVVGIMLSKSVQRVLVRPVFQMLGKYSFPLFLTHTVFLGSVTCFVFTWLHNLHLFGYAMTVAISFFGTLPLLCLATHGVRIVDEWAIKTSRAF